MSINTNPTFEKGWDGVTKEILNADGTNEIDLVDASAISEGVKLDTLMITSTEDTVASPVMNLFLNDGSNSRQIGIISVPQEAGTKSDASVPAVNGLDGAQMPGLPMNIAGMRELFIPGGWKLTAKMGVAVTAAKKVEVVAGWKSITA